VIALGVVVVVVVVAVVERSKSLTDCCGLY